MFERLISLIGINNYNKIRSKKILLLGLGGVGGYTFESLIRNGFKNITIIDNDIIDETNLNRQILALNNNLKEDKTKVAIDRANHINSKVNIEIINKFIEPKDIEFMELEKYDYVIDAIDYIPTKIAIMKCCYNKKINIISSMGTAKKTDATKLNITTLDKTSYDSLARIIRKQLSFKEQKYIKVVSSTECIKKSVALGSCAHVPAIAGLLITNYIFNNIIKND